MVNSKIGLKRSNLEYIEDYQIIKYLGRGKSAYSYLIEKDQNQYVYKQMHQEHVDYYQFENKLEHELQAYDILKKYALKIPKLISYNKEKQYLIKEYIDGVTLAEQISMGIFDMRAYLTMYAHASILEQNHINIDYFPTNFIYKDNDIYYIDYEVNRYDPKWNFIHWGSIFLFHEKGFKHYLKDYKDTSLLLNENGMPTIKPVQDKHEAFIKQISLLPMIEILTVLKKEETNPEIQYIEDIQGGFASKVFKIKTKVNQYLFKAYTDMSKEGSIKLEIKAYQHQLQSMPKMIGYKMLDHFIWMIFEFIEGEKTITLFEKTGDYKYIDDFIHTLESIHEEKNNQTTFDFIKEELHIIKTINDTLRDASVDRVLNVLKSHAFNIESYSLSRIHGDYHPWNTIQSKDQLYVVDFMYRYGDFRYDVMWTYALLYRSGYDELSKYFLNYYQQHHPIENLDFFLTLANLRWFVNVKTSLLNQFDENLYQMVHNQIIRVNELNTLSEDSDLSFHKKH